MNKFLKKNKYNLFLLIFFVIVLSLISIFVKGKVDDINMSKYDNDIIIIKGNGDEIKSYSIKELKNKANSTKVVYTNNGLEKIKVEGVSLEKLIGFL